MSAIFSVCIILGSYLVLFAVCSGLMHHLNSLERLRAPSFFFYFLRVKNCANSILVTASASSEPIVNLTIQCLLPWESTPMVSMPLLLLHLLQLMFLLFGVFWNPHPVLDTHPRCRLLLTDFDV
jgi:hypothetical protein